MNDVLSEIIGLLCAEGHYEDFYSNYKEYDKRRNKVYLRKNQRKRIMQFCNKDMNLIYYFIHLLELEFKYSPNINKTHHDLFRVFITKRSILDKILYHTNIGSSKWCVPKMVINGSKKIKRSFIRGFFYGEGCIDKTVRNHLRIRMGSINFKGICLLSKLLNELNIYHSLNGPYIRENQRPYFEIYIRSKSNKMFIKEIIDNNPAGKTYLCRDNIKIPNA